MVYVDLGYMINHAMFQRNGRAGYVLKPLALRSNDKQLLAKRTKHLLNITVRLFEVAFFHASHIHFLGFSGHFRPAAATAQRL